MIKAKSEAFRTRAKQLRSVAEDIGDQKAKAVLLDAAEDYEAMALEAEGAARQAGKGSNRPTAGEAE